MTDTNRQGSYQKSADVIVVGAGAAGMMAAARAASMGCSVLLLEKNQKVGRKIGITGKGRCNLTNNCDMREFMTHVVNNPRFLYSSLSRFAPADMIALMEENGVPVKTERGRRVFPDSDRSFDVIDGLLGLVKRSGARVLCGRNVDSISFDPGRNLFTARTGSEQFSAPAMIVTTGGLSYPSTGSTGDGLRWASHLGLDVTDCRPSLVPFTCRELWCRELMGLSLKNISIRIRREEDHSSEPLFSEFGEMLFTHFGVSGPVILSASSFIQQYLRKKHLAYEQAGLVLSIDLKPALDKETLDKRLIRDLETYHNSEMRHALEDLLPKRLISIVLKEADVRPNKVAHDLTREERQRLVDVLKDLPLHITGCGGYNEAIITMGGVSVKEIDPSTMMVKTIPGLFMAGEMLDVDAVTGGYNLQIAFTTGRAAGEGAARFLKG